MDEIGEDMAKVDHYRMWYKPVHEYHAMRDVTFFYGLTLPPMDVILTEVRKLLTKSEWKFIIRLLHIFLHDEHSFPFPTLYCMLDWAKWGIYVKAPKEKKENTSHRKVPTFICAACDGLRIFKVVQEIKHLDL